MKDAHGRKLTGRTSWRRFAVLCVPGFAATTALAIALANKLARIAWAVLARGREFAMERTDDAASQPA